MTKLSETLANLGQTEPGRMGFGPRQARQKTPAILIAGYTPDSASVPGEAVDLLILAPGGDGRPASTVPEGKQIWGVAISSATVGELDKVKEAGAQFVLIESDETPVMALRDDGMDRGYAAPREMTDRQAHSLDDSKFEFVVYDASEVSWPLTVGGALGLQERVSLLSKHIFLKVSSLPTADDLEPLRDMPVSALIVDLAKVDSSALKELHDRISELEPRKNRDGSVALIPSSRSNGSSGGDEGDDDDDWDDDDY